MILYDNCVVLCCVGVMCIYVYNYYIKILSHHLKMELFRIEQLVLKLRNYLTVGYNQQVHNTTAVYK